MLPMNYIVHIYSFYMRDNTAALQQSPMTIYYKSRGSLVLANFGQKMCKTTKKPMFNRVSKPNTLHMS